ncbi:mucin-5B-like [Elgaria multicarinata webbii]|uniref:mucin-5B-like n=1 Tax=Elgaria multicarinata webbii TaxID=159646 RepID=UPI002FCD4391
MEFGSGLRVPLWALMLTICSIQQKVSSTEEISGKVTIIPPLTTTPVITSFNSAHNGQVCSTWGHFHFKTFDGDIYNFPGTCNYVFASHCNAAFEDFNIQMRRSGVGNPATISYVTMRMDGVDIVLEENKVVVNGARVELPYTGSGFSIEKFTVYIKVTVKLVLTLMWNEKDSLMLELDKKYANQTCGLCGDFNGIPTYNEFLSNNAPITALQFGNMQKLNGPTEECEDPAATFERNCTTVNDICQNVLTGSAFSDCHAVVGVNDYIEACKQDLCLCDPLETFSCLCNTFAEYSRQCAHAGGQPQNWRTADLCLIPCSFGMQYEECGSPCANTCTNSERSHLCEEHCVDGCFCPPGTVYDDINGSGCMPLETCSCIYNGKTYAPGTTYTDRCSSCSCTGAQWTCTHFPCPGICSVEGGSHISTYDEKRYNVYGDCTYVLSKVCEDNSFTVLGELRRCGLTETETCLKMIALSINGEQTNIVVKPNGDVFFNWIYTQLPISAANVTIFRPSTFFIIIATNFGLQLEIQLTPLMQVYINLDPSFKERTCGLCGNFDSRQTDDFKAISGVVEGSASAFANTWKTQASCPNIKHSFEDPCTLSIENEKYAHHWCGLLTDSEGPFAKCHPSVNPAAYHKNCMFDTCNCERSEDCMCAALSAYVRACAARGVELPGWRTDVCSKYTTSCPKSLNYTYTISSCQTTCRSLSEPDVTCNIKFVPVDGCTCESGTYLDDSGKCVPANKCPCYYKGTPVLSGEVLHDLGVVCTCNQGKLNCIGGGDSKPVCAAPMVYFDCTNATVGSIGAECQKSCQTLDMHCYSTQCTSGCMCPYGLVSDGKGGCIAEEECPCIHNDVTYEPGEKIKVDCNTCVCKNRMWKCTTDRCLGTCAVYGDGHYTTFDDKRYTFNGKCEYTLVQDHCGQNSSTQGTFRIITENIPCGTTGTTCSKSIKVFMGNYELILSEAHHEVVKRGDGNDLPFRIRYMGIYLVIEINNGLIILWDKKTSIFMKLTADYKGHVCGLCGNYDGNGINDFTTRSQSVVGDVLEFGNSWKVSPTCPDAKCLKDPCSKNPYRKSWSQKQCSIIHSDIFAACHSQVDPTKFYEACVTDACACDTGGDCECFCTAVAAYAQACSEFGVCISWRSPSICPMFCDYYNSEGDCNWHYKPCGAPCMKTCRNPSGRCLYHLPGLEGCYPHCPADKPYFNEDEMKCVGVCGCYDPQGNYYPPGKTFYSRETCQSCKCTSKGIECSYDAKACYCYYEEKEYIYKDVIYNTTDGLGWCMTAICEANGTISRQSYECPGITATTPFTFSTTPPITAESTTPRTTACVHRVCEWTQWYDVSYPNYGSNNGDYETPENIRAKGHSLCKMPDEVECRAKNLPDEKMDSITQKIQCTKANGLICNNKEQDPPICYNYEIKFLCCQYIPCGLSTATPVTTASMETTRPSIETSITTPSSTHSKTEHQTSIQTAPPTTSESTTIMTRTTGQINTSTICLPKCKWSPWFDTTHPTEGTDGGDFENYENIRAQGNNICEKPENIECRAEKYREYSLTQLGQKLVCNISVGLLCKNADQSVKFPKCHNYEVRFQCCDYTDCQPGTITPGSTIAATTTTQGTTLAVITTPAPSTSSMPRPAVSTTTQRTTLVSTTIGRTTGKQTATTLTIPSSTIQITTPSKTNTPSLTPGTVPTVTATSLQSTPLAKPTATIPTVATTEETTSGVIITTTTLAPTPSTAFGSTSSFCLPKCQWTPWFDTTQPTNGIDDGDFETYENIRAQGNHICKKPEAIECRAQMYREYSLTQLGQKVECNIAFGLVCNNSDQSVKFQQCHNYEVRVRCCDYSHCSPGTTPGSTTAATTTAPGSTPGRITTAASSTSSGPPPGVLTTTESTTVVSTTQGRTTEKETTTTLTTPISTVSVTTPSAGSTHSVTPGTVPSVTTTSVQSTPLPTTTSTIPITPVITTTTLAPTPSTAFGSTSSFCLPKCQWTPWFDTTQPTNGIDDGDFETYENIRAQGNHICKKPEAIECRAQMYREYSLTQLGQKVECNIAFGLVCNNSDQSVKFQQCHNYEVRVRCCDYSHCSPGTTPGSTTAATTTAPGSTPGRITTAASSTSSGPPPGVLTTTESTTVVSTTQGRTTEKETTTTLTTPISTVSVTTPSAGSTHSVTPGTVPSVTTTSVQSTPLPTTTSTIPITPVITTTTLAPTPSTAFGSTSSFCLPKCQWTPWFDTTQPTNGIDDGDFETYENIRKHGGDICKKPHDIDCRSEKYPDHSLTQLGQKVECNIAFGLVCNNSDQSVKFQQCLNYEVRVRCCDYSHCSPGTTPGSTTAATTTAPGSTPGRITTAASSTSSGPPPGVLTTTESTTVVSTTQGRTTEKETTTTLTTPISTVSVTTPSAGSTHSVTPGTVPSVTTTSVQSTPLPTTTSTIPITPVITTTTLAPTPSTAFGSTSSFCLPKCQWTPWFDTTQPTNGIDDGDFETYENIRAQGNHICKKPEAIECRAQMYREYSLTQLGQKVECNIAFGLVCNNSDQSVKFQQCHNYEVRVRCCDYSHCSPGTTPGSTTAATTTAPGSTPGRITTAASSTSSGPPPGVLTTTESTTVVSTTQGRTTEKETTTTLTTPISTVSVTTPSAGSTHSVTPGTVPSVTTTSVQSTPLPTTTSTIPITPVITTTTLAPTPSTAFGSTSSFCLPKCQWTPWFDTTQPTNGIDDGDFETYENIRKHGGDICKKPHDIDCRSEKYPDHSLTQLGQKVECNIAFGLVCNNSDQSVKFQQCLNYQVRVRCCDYSHCSPGTTPGSTTAATTTAPGSTPGRITTAASSTSSGPPPGVLTTTESTTVVSTTQGRTTEKETTTTLTTPISTVSVTTPSAGSTHSVTPGTVPSVTTTSVQSTPLPTTTSTIPITPVITTTTLAPTPSTAFGSTSSFCLPKCQWTPWFDTTQPTNGIDDGDFETYENIRAQGNHICKKPEAIECRAQMYREYSLTQLGQKVECNIAFGLVCNNSDQSVKFQQCHNYEVRVRCCDYSHCSPGTTPGSTTAATTTAPGSTPGRITTAASSTSSGPPPGVLTTTESTTVVSTTQGRTTEKETTTTLTTPISTVSVTTPSAGSTHSVTPGTVPSVTTTSVQSTPLPTTTSTIPITPVITTTTLAPTPSTAFGSTSSFCLPKCQWTPWFDTTQPTNGIDDGDFETYENIRAQGNHICKKPEAIECRAQMYREYSLTQLGQKVECNIAFGLVCNNSDQSVKFQQCHNYEVRVRCCDYSHCSPGTTPGSTTAATTTAPGSTPGRITTAASSTSSGPPPGVLTTTESTTVVSTTQGRTTEKETTTTLTTPISTVSVTTPSAGSTHSVTPGTVPSVTTTSVQSTPLPTTTSTIPITPVITTTTLAPTPSTAFGSTSSFCLPKCQWTPWFDTTQPTNGIDDGDFETYENIRAQGNHICKKPEDIECRAEMYREYSLTQLGQKVECNIAFGLVCNNSDQSVKFQQCHNYQVRVRCCDYSHCSPGTTPGSTTAATTTAPGSTPGRITTAASSTSSGPPPGVLTTTESTTVVSTTQGRTTEKETTTTLTTPISTVSVTTPSAGSTHSVTPGTVPSVTTTSVQSTPLPTTTSTIPITPVITTTTLAPTPSTAFGSTSSFCLPKCQWTPWFDTTQPTNGIDDGDFETYENIRAQGNHICKKPEAIECRAQMYREYSLTQLGQKVECNIAFGLVCNNSDQSVKFQQCHNYEVRVRCCDYSHCSPGTTPGSTTAATTTAPGSTPGRITTAASSTSSGPPPGVLTTTESTTVVSTTQGRTTEKETTTTLTTPISTVSVTTPSAGSTHSVTPGTVPSVTTTSVQSTPLPTTTSTIPITPVITTTTLAPTPSTAFGSTSSFCLPKCQWTPWFDTTQPTNGIDDGDFETYENIRAQGNHICKKPEAIECRAQMYREYSLTQLGQKVECNIAFGLVCNNSDQSVKFQQCHNYEVRVRCCDYSHCSPGTTPGSTTAATTTAPGSTPGRITTAASSTSSGPPPGVLTTTESTTVVSTTQGRTTEKETTTTLTTPISTVSVTTPSAGSTHSVTPGTVPSVTTTSVQSTPLPTTTSTIPITPVITTTTLAPTPSTAFGSTSSFCLPKCQWTPWFDTTQPTNGIDDGDFETYENIRAQGNHICKKPEAIECRAQMYREYSLTQLGQKVECNIAFGLVCNNSDQSVKFQQCHNYEVRVRCCDYSHCSPGTTPGSTTAATTTAPGSTPGRITTAASSTSSGPPPGVLTTTESTTVVSTTQGRTTEKETTTTLTTPISTVSVTTPSAGSTHSVTPGTVPSVTTTSVQSTPLPTTTSTIPITPVITTTTLAPTPSTAFGSTSSFCLPKCQWTPWFDTTQPTNGIDDGDFETYENIRAQGNHICKKPEAIECRAQMYREYSLTQLGQKVECNIAFGLVCNNSDQSVKFQQCHNYEVRVRCCDYSHCSPGTTPGSTTAATTTAPGSTPGRITTAASSTSSGPPPGVLTTTESTTVVSTTQGRTTEKETTTTLTTPISTVSVTTPSAGSTHSVTPGTVPSVTTTSVQSTPLPTTTSTIPITPVITTTTLAPTPSTAFGSTSSFCLPKCQWTPWFDTTQPTNGIDDGDFETYENIRAQGNHICKKPEAIECRAQMYREYSLTQLGQKVECNIAFGLVCNNSDQSVKFQQCHNYEVRVRCCDYSHCSPGTTPGSTTAATTTAPGSTPGRITTAASSTSSGPPPGVLTTTESTTVVSTTQGRTTEKETTTTLTTPISTVSVTTPSAGSTHSVTPGTVPSVTTTSQQSTHVSTPTATPIIVSTSAFTAGQLIYNRTDNSGCRFYAVCNQHCEVERKVECPSTTSRPSTSPVTTVGTSSTPKPTVVIPSTESHTSSLVPTEGTTPVPGCPNVDPPRKVNETWMLNNCTMATCEGNNITTLVHQPPAEKIECANGVSPVEIIDKDGCPRYECECICTGWDNFNYRTFDGTSYTFHENCTYVLAKEIVDKHGNFSVLVNNYFCDVANNQSCSRSIIVNYNSMEVVLSSQMHKGVRINKVLFNNEPVSSSFTKNGISVTSVGTTMTVEIPAIQAFISFNGRAFTIKLPFGLFEHNTEGQCGICSNDRSDDCRLPSGHEASSCSDMAPHWKVYDPENPYCGEVTPEPTGPPPTLCTTPSPLCEVIMSDTFADCHKILPPKDFYDACLLKACQNSNNSLNCDNIEMYASLCTAKGVCTDWRNTTEGKCPYHCPKDKVYDACGPIHPATCDNGQAKEVSAHVAEGCFCPKDKILFNTYTDICVSECGCVGPDGMPKPPGTKWKSNCQECLCDPLSLSVQCKPVICEESKIPICEKEGFMPVPVLIPEDPCCPEINCICNVSACTTQKKSCEPGYVIESILFEGDCCVTYNCKRKAGSLQRDGSLPFIANTLSTTQGYEYQVESGKCCGTCVQVYCTINLNGITEVFKPGDIWYPEANNCSQYTCEPMNDTLVPVKVVRACPDLSLEECDPADIELSADGCCKVCKPQEIKSCKVHKNKTLIRQNECISSEVVELTYCEGACPSSSMYSSEAKAMQHKCTCCQELKSHRREVNLTCQDGKSINYDYIYVDECECMTACMPQNTVR